MENIQTEEKILNDLIKSCKQQFGFNVLETKLIRRGWLNLKWKITTDSGIFLPKQYNKKRLKKYNYEELLHAFELQMRLNKKGSYEGQFL